MILYDTSYIWHIAGKGAVTDKFLLFQITEYFHIRPYTFLKRKVLYLIVAYPFESKVGKKAGNTQISPDGGKYW